MTRQEKIELLKAKIRKREDRAGFEANVREIRARLAELEQETGG